MAGNKVQQSNQDRQSIGPSFRLALSFIAILHVLAVLAEPLRFFSQSPVKYASEEARWLRMATGPYVDFMYLSHGYSFFAPNPGPSHLLECEIVSSNAQSSDGSNATQRSESSRSILADANRTPSRESSWRLFPDRKKDWPRLLYHRHFMLSEFYQTQFAPASLTEQERLEPNILEQWKQDRQQYVRLQESIKKNLAQSYRDSHIVLRRIEHGLPSEYQVLVDRWKLTDPRLYVELPEGESTAVVEEGLPKP